MKYFIILLIASFVFFGCDANDAGDGDGGTTDPGSNGSTGPFEGLGLCVGSWGEVENGTTISHENEDYSSIINQAGLQAIEDDLTARYILCNDIEIDSDSESAFTQINPDLGTDSNTFDGTEFTGTLEGNNRTISNLRIQAANREYVGLFGKIGTAGEVKDLYLSLADLGADPSISGEHYVGALVGENEGTITKVRVTGGYIKGDAGQIGGLVGYNDGGGTIEYSSVSGDVKGNSSVGGLVGDNNGRVEYSYAAGTVTGTGSSSAGIGGLVGYNAGTGTITASYATGGVTGNIDVGGLVGANEGGTVEKSYATGNVTGNSRVGGLVGSNGGGTITASYFDAALTGQGGAGTAYYTYTDPVDGDDLVYTQANGVGDLIAQSNFPTWDDTIWTWQEGQWPLLQFQ